MRIVVAGPDGAGKSSLVAGLTEALAAAGQPCATLHFNKPVTTADQPVTPHSRRPWPGPVCHVRLLLRFPSFWRRAARDRRDDVVVVEQRFWWDQAVDPARYRLSPSAGRLAAVLARLLPKADLALLLRGDPRVLAGRKGELTTAETARQLRHWERVIADCAKRWVVIDTSMAPLEACVAEAHRALTHGDRHG
jgi:thymidylate kinase